MGFRSDDRAVTVQIGAVLLFGVLIVSLSVFQTTVVPSENKEVEFSHNQRVQNDMQSVRNAVIQSASESIAQPTTVELGTQYPSRAVLINPGTPSGRLYSQAVGNVTVANATAVDGQTADFWTGSDDRNYSTSELVYEPTYNVYQNAPTTVVENTVALNEFENGRQVSLTGQTLVDGDRLTIITVNGTYSQAATRSVSIDPEAVSEVTTTTITDSGGNVSFVIPTRLSASAWEEIFRADGEFDGTGDTTNNEYVHNVVSVPGRSAVRVVMEEGVQYRLRMGKVGVGRGVTDVSPAYITTIERATSVGTDRSARLAFEVRDEYNNPISETVTYSASAGSLSLVSNTDGRVVLDYTAPSAAQTDTIKVSYLDEGREGFADSNPEDVELSVVVQDTDSTNSPVSWIPPDLKPGAQTNPGVSCPASGCNPIELTALAGSSGTSLEFTSDDSSVASVSPSSATTGSDSRATTGVTLKAQTGVATLTVTDDSTSDTIDAQTFVASDFENGLGVWSQTTGGDDGVGTTNQICEPHDGDAAYVGADSNGDTSTISTPGYDTSGTDLLVFEFWAGYDQCDDGGSNNDPGEYDGPDTGQGYDEDLLIQYQNESQSGWTTVDTIEVTSDSPQEFRRQVRIDGGALDGDVTFRFKLDETSTESGDYWFVDDVRITNFGEASSGSGELQFIDGSVSEPEIGVLRFDVENPGGSEVTIEKVKFSVSNGKYSKVGYAERSGDELDITGGASGGLNARIDEGAPAMELDTFATLQSRGTATVELGTFIKGNNGNVQELGNINEANSQKARLTITLVLSDGTEVPFYFKQS